MEHGMSPARFLRPLHLATGIAAFSFTAGADATSPRDTARALLERASSAHKVPAKAMTARAAGMSEPTARPAKHLASPARPAKANPACPNAAERAKDFGSRGNFAMHVGQTAEAIGSFEHALDLDPSFTEAWGKLAFLYLKEGNSTKAVDAFKKAKLIGDANGGLVTRDASGALLFP
jgi:tetratricopeptide (TPR) repeat protein